MRRQGDLSWRLFIWKSTLAASLLPLPLFVIETVAFGQPDHRLLEVHFLMFHQKLNDAAMNTTAEAVVKLPTRVNDKGWRLFFIEGAQANMFLIR